MRPPHPFRIPACLLMLLMLAGCGGSRHAATQTLTGYAGFNTRRMAVMPFLPSQPPQADAAPLAPPLDCTLEQLCDAINPEIAPGAEMVMAQAFQDALAPRLGARLLPLDQASRAFQALTIDRRGDTLRDLAMRFGAALEADHVVVGTVWRFQDRQREEGASVGFAAYCVEVGNRRRIWRAQFDHTQRSLTDDLLEARLFFRGGARWLTAAELARYGVAQVMEQFPEVPPP